MHRRPRPPRRPALVDRVEDVRVRDLRGPARARPARRCARLPRHVHRLAVRQLGRGRLAPRAQAGRTASTENRRPQRQERRPQRQLAQHPVAAVLQQRHAAVQAQHADERQDLHQPRPPADQQPQVDEAAQREAERDLVGARQDEEEREHPLRGRPPQHHVVRHQPLVRIEQRDDRGSGAPDRTAGSAPARCGRSRGCARRPSCTDRRSSGGTSPRGDAVSAPIFTAPPSPGQRRKRRLRMLVGSAARPASGCPARSRTPSKRTIWSCGAPGPLVVAQHPLDQRLVVLARVGNAQRVVAPERVVAEAHRHAARPAATTRGCRPRCRDRRGARRA